MIVVVVFHSHPSKGERGRKGKQEGREGIPFAELEGLEISCDF